MAMTVDDIRAAARKDSIRYSIHASRRVSEEGISTDELRFALSECEVIEDYPTHERGACCLVLGQDGGGQAIHAVCAMPEVDEVLIVTAYRPDPDLWIEFRIRRE